jgi:hypothetical protein
MTLSRVLVAAGLLGIAPAFSGHAEDAVAKWEAAFSVAAAPTRVYFRARYIDGRGLHELEVWRDGNRQLRRKTDAAIDLYVDKDNAGNLDYRIVDHARHVLIRADRMTMYRIGRFSGWNGLAHMLDIPAGSYEVTALPLPPESTRFGECRWFRLRVDQPARSNDVCWSRAWGIPFEIAAQRDGKRVTQFSIEDVREFKPQGDAVFAIDSRNLVEVDGRVGADLSD